MDNSSAKYFKYQITKGNDSHSHLYSRIWGVKVKGSSKVTAYCLKRTPRVVNCLECCVPYSRRILPGDNKTLTNASVLALIRENLKFGRKRSFLIY